MNGLKKHIWNNVTIYNFPIVGLIKVFFFLKFSTDRLKKNPKTALYFSHWQECLPKRVSSLERHYLISNLRLTWTEREKKKTWRLSSGRLSALGHFRDAVVQFALESDRLTRMDFLCSTALRSHWAADPGTVELQDQNNKKRKSYLFSELFALSDQLTLEIWSNLD